LGTVLIIGGTGSLGSAIARHLLTSAFHAKTRDVHILSRTPPSSSIKASLPGATYHHFSLTDESALRDLISKTQPAVVFHTFSPKFTVEEEVLWEGNVVGTSVVVKCCLEAPSVKALVYTSSDSVVEVLRLDQGETILTEDTCRLIDPENKSYDAYRRTKCIAEGLVLNANCAKLKTAALRFGTMYGEGDRNNLPLMLEVLKKGDHRTQMGPNTTPRELLYIPSNASAHVLAAQALLAGKGVDGGKVDGEVFFISDKEKGEGALMFWDFLRMVWAAAGDRTKKEEVTVIPIWLAMFFIGLTEWLYWVGTAGRKKPEVTRLTVSYMFMPVRVDIPKAVNRLGYQPLVSVEEGVKRGVDWIIQQGWKE